jgi:hypothetical protein
MVLKEYSPYHKENITPLNYRDQLVKETILVYTENHTTLINTKCKVAFVNAAGKYSYQSVLKRSRVNSVSIVSDYWLDVRAIGVRPPAGAKDFSSILCVQTGSGAHPASCTMGTGGPFPGGKSAAAA